MKENKKIFANSKNRMKYFNRNAFTLIELLAIIVILAIIAVITVPIILNVIDNSKKGAAQDSALGYKDAVQKYYMNGLLYNQTQELPSGYFLVGTLPSDFTVNGDIPTNDSWVQLEKGQVVAYSLKFGDYTVTKYKDSDIVCEKGEVQENEEMRAQRLRLEAQTQAATEVASYISSLLADSTIQGYTEDTPKKVSDINTPSAPTGVDGNSWIYFKKETSSVTASDYSIKITIGDYTFVVNCVDGTVSSPVESTTIEPQKKNISVEVIKVGSTLATGDTVRLKWGSNTEEFIAILNDPLAPANTTMLLAVNNLNAGSNKNSSSPEGYQGTNGNSYAVAFSKINYWYNYSDLSDIYDSSKDNAPGNDDYSVAYYVNMYVQNLQSLGFNVNSGRILKKSEVDSGGIVESYVASGENYWLGSYSSHPYMWRVYETGVISLADYTNSTNYGVRPVIYISTSDLQ